MALQSLQITAMTAMRARDVSRPTEEQQEAADRQPLRDEMPRRDNRRNRETNGAAGSGRGTA
ncbi:hypothetical protein GCM10023194_59470 [Planotetraspora phitsanulokensis]|uniref:Uncharacterized protein n=1 Tax=Planotetraspora phitsanulokensis TaxID=575192 RepID=A0A8J3U829_9ACTN|nr:hypothetical protein [Planotetraspora phitsanulokensis]GII40408.1 hypothetical protein Pph01_54110 [Planotetraspora phitsanulokensis]